MLWIFLFIAVTGIVAWIGGVQARKRMGKALGRNVRERELTSISTWMEVDKAERKK